MRSMKPGTCMLFVGLIWQFIFTLLCTLKIFGLLLYLPSHRECVTGSNFGTLHSHHPYKKNYLGECGCPETATFTCRFQLSVLCLPLDFASASARFIVPHLVTSLQSWKPSLLYTTLDYGASTCSQRHAHVPSRNRSRCVCYFNPPRSDPTRYPALHAPR